MRQFQKRCDPGRMQQRQRDSQSQFFFTRQLKERLCFGRIHRQRRGNQHMLAGQQCLANKRSVSFCGSGDDHRANFRDAEYVMQRVRYRDARELRTRPCRPLVAEYL